MSDAPYDVGTSSSTTQPKLSSPLSLLDIDKKRLELGKKVFKVPTPSERKSNRTLVTRSNKGDKKSQDDKNKTNNSEVSSPGTTTPPVIRHQLLLEPTRERQKRKQRLRNRTQRQEQRHHSLMSSFDSAGPSGTGAAGAPAASVEGKPSTFTTTANIGNNDDNGIKKAWLAKKRMAIARVSKVEKMMKTSKFRGGGSSRNIGPHPPVVSRRKQTSDNDDDIVKEEASPDIVRSETRNLDAKLSHISTSIKTSKNKRLHGQNNLQTTSRRESLFHHDLLSLSLSSDQLPTSTPKPMATNQLVATKAPYLSCYSHRSWEDIVAHRNEYSDTTTFSTSFRPVERLESRGNDKTVGSPTCYGILSSTGMGSAFELSRLGDRLQGSEGNWLSNYTSRDSITFDRWPSQPSTSSPIPSSNEHYCLEFCYGRNLLLESTRPITYPIVVPTSSTRLATGPVLVSPSMPTFNMTHNPVGFMSTADQQHVELLLAHRTCSRIPDRIISVPQERLKLLSELDLLEKQSAALDILSSATDLATMVASLQQVKILHQNTPFRPAAARIVSLTETTCRSLMQRAFLRHMTTPTFLGGLGYSMARAESILFLLAPIMGQNFGLDSTDLIQLLGFGLSRLEAVDLLPFIQGLEDEIRVKVHMIRSQLEGVSSPGYC